MFLARVTGSVVATQKVASMVGRKLLTVEPLRVDPTGRDKLVGTGRTFVCVDTVGAGLGEMVLIVQGSSARMAPEVEKLPVDATIIGIVDTVNVENKTICSANAEMLGLEEMEETKIGRLKHKVEKLITAGEKSPGVEFLRTNGFGSMNNLTLEEYSPFGIVGTITPVTHSLPTLANNAISMIAAGNAVVCNPHPSGARVACHGTQLFNQAIHKAIGIDSLIAIIGKPTLESAQAIFDHRDVRLLCVTGGPAVGRAALRSPKRAIVAGPGNPPVVVDETADLDNAARSIIKGGAYDNNLLCIGEKEVFAVTSIFDELMDAMAKYKAVQLNPAQIAALTKAAFVPGEGGRTVTNKDLIGMDAAV